MLFYVIFNNGYSGIIQSQVFDRIDFLKTQLKQEIVIVVYVPIRSYLADRRAYRAKSPVKVYVIPMIGGLKHWNWVNVMSLPLFLWYRPRKVIGRAIFATNIGLWFRSIGLVNQVVYDGRGAVSEEWKEYLGQTGWPILLERIEQLESNAIRESNLQLAVSQPMVQYWKDKFGFESGTETVIPCTVGQSFLEQIDPKKISRQSLGFTEQDVILLISASKSDWQNISKEEELLTSMLDSQGNLKLLVLSSQELPSEFKQRFGKRIFQTWVNPKEVASYVSLCDFGFLSREESVTNRVASPVKFAEFICSGLKVLISSSIGDYSEMVAKHDLGLIIGAQTKELSRPTVEDRQRIIAFGRAHLSLSAYTSQLKQVFSN
ncbi:MAG: hypothetical protein RIF46_11265 [Cyclobacteriaceae bacterium]